MPLPILDSPLLTLPVLDTLLARTTDPVQRVQLLGARVHVLAKDVPVRHATGAPSASAAPESALATTALNANTDAVCITTQVNASSTGAAEAPLPAHTPAPRHAPRIPSDPTPILAARLALADAHLLLPIPDLHAAEAEALGVEGECKKLSKAAKRWTGIEAAADGSAEATAWVSQLPALRVRALRVLVAVEEGLGRPARAERWGSLADELEGK